MVWQIKNQENAAVIELQLDARYSIVVINPICLPLGESEEVAWKKCRSLYDACDAVIFCDYWNKSKGCRLEYKWAKADGKPIYRYHDGELFEFGEYQEYIDGVLDPRD